ncbi:hypothetical protein [Hyphomonas sp.]|jgi:putative membrane protein
MALTIQAGSLTHHMAAHIFAMSVLAPLVAWLFIQQWPRLARQVSPRLVVASLLQLTFLALWHSPLVMIGSMQASLFIQLGMLGLLALAASWFWICVLVAIANNRIWVIAPLLLTGKLVCLFAILLVFAPRALYPGMGHMLQIEDQQAAGLLMLTACPLTYVGASIYLVARWFSDLSKPEVRPDIVA